MTPGHYAAEITNIEAEINADKSFIDTLKKHIDASTSLSDAEKAQLDAELKAEEAVCSYPRVSVAS